MHDVDARKSSVTVGCARAHNHAAVPGWPRAGRRQRGWQADLCRRGVAKRARPAHARWRKMRTLELPAPPTAPTAVGLFALPHAHGHARVQRAQPCSAARGRQPAGTAPGNGWRWRPEPLPSRRCATGPATIKLWDNLSPWLCRRPLHGVARGCAGLGAAVPAAPRSITIGHLRTAHNWAL